MHELPYPTTIRDSRIAEYANRAAGDVKQQTEVFSLVNELQNELEMLEKAMAVLHERIGPVVAVNVGNEKERDRARVPRNCGLSSRLDELLEHVLRLRGHTSSVLDRLQL